MVRWSDTFPLVQDSGTGVFTVGINLSDTDELDGVSSKPLEWYQMLINSEGELREIPGIYKYRMENRMLLFIAMVDICFDMWIFSNVAYRYKIKS